MAGPLSDSARGNAPQSGALPQSLLSFNLQGYLHQHGIDRLADGFKLASKGMYDEIENLRKELTAYQDNVAHGGERIGEWDSEDGHTLWEQDQIYEVDIDNAEASLSDLRKAYVLAIYHYWERSTRQRTGSDPNVKHDALVGKVREEGDSIDPRLSGLRDLVNTLKHNNNKWGFALATSWPSVVGSYSTDRSINWYEVLRLEDADVLTACDIVRGSGPSTSKLRSLGKA